MPTNIWKFYLKQNCTDDFVRMNTDAEDRDSWPHLYGRSSDYLGTRIISDVSNSRIYLTLDIWTSEEAFDRFVRENKTEFDRLDALHEELYESAEHIGFFEDDL